MKVLFETGMLGFSNCQLKDKETYIYVMKMEWWVCEELYIELEDGNWRLVDCVLEDEGRLGWWDCVIH